MPEQRDTVLIEQAKIQRMRLGSAMLYGALDERRTVGDNVRRFIASIVVTAVVCAGCVGVSFVGRLLGERAAAAPAVVPEAPAFAEEER